MVSAALAPVLVCGAAPALPASVAPAPAGGEPRAEVPEGTVAYRSAADFTATGKPRDLLFHPESKKLYVGSEDLPGTTEVNENGLYVLNPADGSVRGTVGQLPGPTGADASGSPGSAGSSEVSGSGGTGGSVGGAGATPTGGALASTGAVAAPPRRSGGRAHGSGLAAGPAQARRGESTLSGFHPVPPPRPLRAHGSSPSPGDRETPARPRVRASERLLLNRSHVPHAAGSRPIGRRAARAAPPRPSRRPAREGDRAAQ
ncbi:hypothetical protein AB0P15_16290 [Streptomyces sp. NPDC087917]|uniref:hypothetical protein n=1 Tax=Streptomyces sp. NPDC087917 TaxID=3155060 RepID=UPI00343DEB38